MQKKNSDAADTNDSQRKWVAKKKGGKENRDKYRKVTVNIRSAALVRQGLPFKNSIV